MPYSTTTTRTPSPPVRTSLRTREDVTTLLSAVKGPAARHQIAPVGVRLPGLSPAAALKTELRLNSLAQDCGCSVGSGFMAASALAGAVYLLLSPGSGHPSGSDLFAVAAVVLVAALVGKLAGIVRARVLLVRELERLAAAVDSQAVEVSDGHCL